MGKASRKKKQEPVADGRSQVGPSDVRPATRDPRLAKVAVALALLVLATFSPVVTHEFINYDDPDYVYANPAVQRGLTLDGIKYAFTTIQPYYWQPLTWLSLELDSTLGGTTRPTVFLVVNVLLHAAAVVLLFLLLARTTGATLASAAAAAIWAVHPLRVESVAWVAERKDVLSTLLFIAALFAYTRFVEVRSRSRYAVLIGIFVLALMAKPMVVTLPAALLLFDIWPLKRRPAIKDKIPLAVLAIAIVAITFFGQRTAIAATLPLGIRLANAVTSTAAYLGKIIFPSKLAIIYPYSYSIPTSTIVASAVLLIAITAVVLYLRKPPLTSGWFWFLVTLVPVMGIVQAGPQSMADRFTYIPTIGFAFIIHNAWTSFSGSDRLKTALTLAVIAILAIVSVFNLRYWKDSVTVFTHALEVTKDNAIAQVKLGDALIALNRVDEANAQYAEAVRTSRGGAAPLASAASALVQQKRYAEAVGFLEQSVAQDPNHAAARENLGAALMNTGRAGEAIPHFEAALKLGNGSRRAEILQGLGDSKRLAGRVDEGIADLRASIDLKPTAEAWNDLGSAYSSKGEVAAADRAFSQALRINPDLYDAHLNYGAMLSREGRADAAATQMREAMRLSPKAVEPRIYLALVMGASGRKGEAAAIASDAMQMDAKASNDVFTRALHLPPKETNLQEFIAKMQQP